MTLRWAMRASAWILLAGWFGSYSLFAFVIAPTAFQVLPSQAAAGSLVSPVLAVLHNYGILAGVALTGLNVAARRGWLMVSVPLVLACACAVSEYWVTPAIGEVLPRSFGIAQEEEPAERFSRLHQTSRFLFGIVQFGTLGLIVALAREGPGGPQQSDP
jgi:hypothetical protein